MCQAPLRRRRSNGAKTWAPENKKCGWGEIGCGAVPASCTVIDEAALTASRRRCWSLNTSAVLSLNTLLHLMHCTTMCGLEVPPILCED